MMIGINNIGHYIASDRISNLEKAEKHVVTRDFIANKVGITAVARKKPADFATCDISSNASSNSTLTLFTCRKG